MKTRNIWVGSNYSISAPRILILGESDYGGTDPLPKYLPTWFDGAKDQTFTRIFNSFSGKDAASASYADRKAFWDNLLFYNFVTSDVGPTREHRPTADALRASREPLDEVLTEYSPQGVIILGLEQAQYSQPVIAQRMIPHEVSPHPTSFGLKTQTLTDKWNDLQEKLAPRG